MKIYYTLLLIVLSYFNSFAQPANKWPNDKKGVIILTYDDALISHIQVAIPQLNKVNLKGTFFLDGRVTIEEMKKWEDAGKKGHEIANHSLNHPCLSSTIKRSPKFVSDNYDVEMILREISAMNKILYGINGNKTRTYAYPCVEFEVGGKDYRDTLKATGLVKYARGGGDKNAIIVDPKSLDFYNVPSWGIAKNTDGAELIDFAKRVKEANGIGVLMFHGVGGDYLDVSSSAHEQLLKFLADKKNEIWVGTFQEVMDYISKHE